MSRLESLIDALESFYGALPSPPGDPFALFVWEVLSVRSTPRKRDAAFGALKRARALTPDALWRAPQKTLQESIALAGPYAEQRLGALRTGADRFRRSPRLPQVIRGPLTGARKALNSLPQMGDGGAERMLLFAAGHPVLPVDGPVGRVARRLGYGGQRTASAGARAIRKALVPELRGDVDVFRRAFLYLSMHGSATCTETDPHCAICPLLRDCHYGNERLQTADFRLEISD